MDIEWVIYHLIHNDDENFTSIVDLDIDLCRSDLDQWDRLLIGLSRNRTVTSIELLRGYQSPVATEDDLQRLFSALRQLPRLSKVKIDSFTTFDLEQTKFLFLDNDVIEEIWIENAHCYFEDEEESLDEDELDDYQDHMWYEHFIGYLASMSRNRLRHLRIQIPEKLSQGANMTSLLSGSSKLESLVIESTSALTSTAPITPQATPPTDDNRRRNFATAMAALQSNSVLKTLDMDFHLSFADFRDVATMLKHNRTLTNLSLRLDTSPAMIYFRSDGVEHVHDYNPLFIESIQLFFEALKTNTYTALKKFSQYNVDDRKLRQAVLAHHDTVLTTSVMSTTYTRRAQNLIELGLDMLQFNLSLESFSFFLLDPNNPNLTKKKQMFLRLNERGRRLVQHRDIRERVEKSAWVDQLSKHSMDDLDGLYYYISTNPLICRTIQEDVALSDVNTMDIYTAIGKKNGRNEEIVRGSCPKRRRVVFQSSCE